jgi:hypothetical protein
MASLGINSPFNLFFQSFENWNSRQRQGRLFLRCFNQGLRLGTAHQSFDEMSFLSAIRGFFDLLDPPFLASIFELFEPFQNILSNA